MKREQDAKYQRPIYFKCCYFDMRGSCFNQVNGPNQYCQYHSAPIIYFNNTMLDTKLLTWDINKQKKLAEAITDYGIDPLYIDLNNIRKIYRQREMKNHPDKGGNTELFKRDLYYKELLEEFIVC